MVDGVAAGLIRQSSRRGTALACICPSAEDDLGDSSVTILVRDQLLQLSPARSSGSCTRVVLW